MATFTMSLAMTTGAPLTKTVTLTDANAQRIIAAYRTILDAPQNATAASVWDRIVQGTFDGVKANTISHETEEQRAAVTVPDIAGT